MEHIEGRQSVLAALRAYQRRFQVILIRHDAHREKLADVIGLAEKRGVPIRYVEAAELDALAHGATHGGVVAICTAKPRLTAEELLALVDGAGKATAKTPRAPRTQRRTIGEGPKATGGGADEGEDVEEQQGGAAGTLREPALLLLLEGVDDARNLGFTLRSADAFGVHAVMIKKHLWEFDAVEVGRPAAGAYERLALAQIEDVEVLRGLQKRGVRVIGCVAGAKRSLYEAELAGPVVLAIGGEKRGLSGAVRAVCDEFVSIPTRAEASLSLSHAASIVMAEARRQRQPPRRQERQGRGEEE
jgi:tRNA G18 (ribose-2'-O)-methylase SpoU